VNGEKLWSFSLFVVTKSVFCLVLGGGDISQLLSATDFPSQVHISADFGVFETV